MSTGLDTVPLTTLVHSRSTLAGLLPSTLSLPVGRLCKVDAVIEQLDLVLQLSASR